MNYNENFETILSDMKINVPTILTEKVVGIRMESTEEPEAPQKFYVVFETEKPSELSQISVIYDQKTQKSTIMDVQTVVKQEIIAKPQPVIAVKLSQDEILQENILQTVSTSPQLVTENIKTVESAEETQTAFTKIITVNVVNDKNEKLQVRTEKGENGQTQVVNVIRIPEQPKPQIITTTTVNPKDGITTTYTNNINVMKEEKTFNKCVTYLDKQFTLDKQGFKVESETLSRLQRIVEHHVRYIKNEEVKDFRVTVDQRTGAVTLLGSRNITLGKEETTEISSFDQEPLIILQADLPQAIKQYPVIEVSQNTIESADYTFKGVQASEVHLTFYLNSVKVIMIYRVKEQSPVRVVLLGDRKSGTEGPASSASYTVKIVDLTTLEPNIQKVETKTVVNEYGVTSTTTNNIKVLEQNNQEYGTVVKFAQNNLPAIKNYPVSTVEIQTLTSITDYILLIKVNDEIVEVRISHRTKTGENVLIDFKTQSTDVTVKQIPIKPIQSIVTVVDKKDFQSPQITQIEKVFVSEKNITQSVQVQSVEIRENPRVINYIMQVEVGGVPTSVEVSKDVVTQETLIVKYRPQVISETVETKPSTSTTVKTDLTTGQQVTITNVTSVIKNSTTVQEALTEVTKQKIVPVQSEVVSAVIKTSENKVYTTLVVKETKETTDNHVIMTVTDVPTHKVTVIGEKVVTDEKLSTVETSDLEEKIFEKEILTRPVFETLIKTDKPLQEVFTQVKITHPQVTFETVEKVETQQVGQTTVTTVVTSEETYTLTTDKKTGKVTELATEPVPQEIVPSFYETTSDGVSEIIFVSGTQTTTLEATRPEFTQVLTQVEETYGATTEDVVSVTATKTVSGYSYELIVKNTEESEPYQVTIFYDSTTEETTDMGSVDIPESTIPDTDAEESVTDCEPVPEEEWQTPEVS